MIRYVNTLEQLNDFKDWLKTQRNNLIGFDTETTGLDPKNSKLLLLQFGNEKVQYVINVQKVSTTNGTNIKDIFYEIINNDITLIIHNAKFDIKVIKAKYDIMLTNIFCTFIAARLLTMGRKRRISTNLAITLHRILGIAMEKETRNTFIDYEDIEFTNEQIAYAAKDVKYLIPLMLKLRKKLIDRKLDKVAILEFATVPVTALMELNGAYIHVDKWLKLEDTAKQEAEKYKKLLDQELISKNLVSTNLFGEANINYDSPVQLLPVLQKLSGEPIKDTSKGTLESLNIPFTENLLEYRKYMKLVSTYGTEFLRKHLSKDGKLHTEFNQLGAETGRYSSNNPNLQNIPRNNKYREPFIAPPGYKFISADFSGQQCHTMHIQ